MNDDEVEEMFTPEMVERWRSSWTTWTPDAGYRRSTRRLRVVCWIVAFATFGLCLLLAEQLPVAAVLLWFMSLAALRIGDEVREEIESWPT